MECVISSVTRDEGTIVVFAGTLVDTDQDVHIAVDHRMAGPLAEALEYEEPLVDVESWQIIG